MELTPLEFMPYVANLFREVTGKDLQGLSQFTGWIGLGGYYHWRVTQQGCSIPSLTSKGSRCLRDPYPILVADLTHRGRPGLRLRQLEPLRGDRTEPNQPQIEAEKDPPPARVESFPPPARVGNHPPQFQVESLPPPARVGNHPPQFQVESLPPPARAVNRPPQAEVRNQPPQEALLTRPRKGKEWVMVPGPTGTKGPCAEWKVEPLSPKGLPIRSGRCRQGGRPSVRFTVTWMAKTRPHAISPLGS